MGIVKGRHLQLLSASYTPRRHGQLCWISWILYICFPSPSLWCWPPNWSTLTKFLLAGSWHFDFKTPIWKAISLCNFPLFFFFFRWRTFEFLPCPRRDSFGSFKFQESWKLLHIISVFFLRACSIYVGSFWHSIFFSWDVQNFWRVYLFWFFNLVG